MGCFLGCFGISNSKKKRRKPANRILPGDSKLVSYEPLDSSVSVNLNISETPIPSSSQLSDKPKERSSVKIRKKVSFNLNVQTYEPIPAEETTSYKFLQSVKEKESGKINGADEEALQMGMGSYSYPPNYRYQNCRESYDEEDDFTFEESDFEDDDYYEDDDYDGDDSDDQRQRPEEFLDESKPVECGNARMRGQHLCSVLNPVENTTQWREIKARSAPAAKPRMKENVAVEEEAQIPLSSKLSSKCSSNYNQSRPLLQDIAVDASLSNWLASSNSDESKTTASTKPCGTAFDPFSWRSREDRVILDITNIEGL